MNQRTSQLCASHPFLLRVLTVAEVYRGKGVSYLCGTCHKSDTWSQRKEGGLERGIARLLAKKFMLLDLQPTRSVTERGGEMHKMLSDIKSSEERSRDLDTASLTRVQDQLFH